MDETYGEAPAPSTPAGKILQELMAAGLSGQALVAALDRCVAALILDDLKKTENRRARDAERQREHRARRQIGAANVPGGVMSLVPGTVPGQPAYGLPLPAPAGDFALTPPPSTAVAVIPKKQRKPRNGDGFVCPDDWLAKPIHFALGEKLGLSEKTVKIEAMAMRNWSQANSNRAVARKTNWDLAFNNWLSNRRNNNGNGNNNGPSASASAAAQQHTSAAQRGEFHVAARPVLQPAGAGVVRPIPKG